MPVDTRYCDCKAVRIDAPGLDHESNCPMSAALHKPAEPEEVNLRVVDNDRDEITVMNGDKEVRGWSYSHPQEQYWKMQMAREFVEGWYLSSQGNIK